MLNRVQKETIESIKRGYEQKGMKEIKGHDGVWRPTIVGEVLEGEYLECVPDADNYHRNKYIFSDDGQLKDSNTGRPVGLNGKIALFGGVTLDDRMAWIPMGAKVAIIYSGEKPNPGYKNPTKLFTVMSDQELDVPVNTTPTTQEDGNPPTSKTCNLNNLDDPAAREMIRDCKTFLDSEGKKNHSILDIADYAEKIIQNDDKPDLELLDHIHTLLAQDVIAECAITLATKENLSPTEEEVAACAKKLLKNNRSLLTKVQLLLAENVKSKKEKEEGN